LSWTGLLECADDIVTDYSRPSPNVESTSEDDQNRNPSVSKTVASPITPKPFIKFVKPKDSQSESKTDKKETPKKPPVKYAEQYRKPNKKPNVRGNQRNWNNLKSHQLGPNFVMNKKSYFNCGDFNHLASDCRKRVKQNLTPRPVTHKTIQTSQRPVRTFFDKQAHSYTNRFVRKTSAVRTPYRAPWVPSIYRNYPPVNRKLSTGSRNFPTGKRKFPTASRKFPTGSTKSTTANMGMKGKAVKPAACWFWKPSQNQSNKGPKNNNVSVMFKKYTYIDTQGRLKGEFRNKEMNDFCSQKGIMREFSNARTPQQNGVAKKRNKTLIEAARTMLADAKLPVTFWAEGVNTACYVQDMFLVNKSHNKTPCELFNGRSPAIGFLKPFGCHVMILNTLDNLGKFEGKEDEGYFIGYSMSSKAFRVFNKRTRRVEENLHVEFLENKAIEKGAGPNWLFDIDSLTKSMNYVPVDAGTISTNLSGTKDAANQEVKKDVSSLRYIALPNWAHDALLEFPSSKPQNHCSTDVLEDSGNPNPTASTPNPPADHMKTLTVETPILTVNESNGEEADMSNMETAITASPTPTLRIHKDHPKCQIIGLVDNLIQTKNKSKENVWTLVDCPKGVRPIGTKWVLKNKKDERGIVIRNKARLVAQGHTQEEGIDYDEVFTHVARIEAIRLFLAYASFMGFIVYQMDMKSAFLYGTIDEKVHQVTLKECHLHAVKRIFRYLKGHPKLGLWYPKESPFDLVAFSNSDYGGATQDRKSTTGGCQFFGRRLISWQCKKQTIVATSTTEA
nr:putative ribonuclease H-like domain-containing protein [Tanacetum cinerariifolium]